MRKSRILVYILTIALLLVVLVPQGVHAAGITYDSTHSNNSGLTSAASQVDTVTVTKGQTLVVAAGRLDPTTSGTVSISDTGGTNVYTQQVNIVNVITTGAGGEWLQIWTAPVTVTGSITITVTYSDGQNRQTSVIADLFNGVGSVSNAQGVLIQNTYVNGVGQFQNNTITLTGVKTNAWVYESDSMQDSVVDPKALGGGQTTAQLVNNLGSTAAQGSSDYASTTTATQQMTVFMHNLNGDNWSQGVIELDPATPTVTSVSPNVGIAGVLVNVTGTNLGSATSVTVCGTAATISVNAASTLTFYAPAQSSPRAQTCDVVVTTGSGSSAIVTADQFAYTDRQAGFGGFAVPPVNYAIIGAIVGTIVIIGVVVALRRH